jgi:arylsulfatase A-like enzyme
MASFAKMLGEKLPENEFTDSRDYFNTLIGKQKSGRDYVIEQPINKLLAIVKDGWKYIRSGNGPAVFQAVHIESGYSKEDQLYNLQNDLREMHNLASKYPEKLKELKTLLSKAEAEKE